MNEAMDALTMLNSVTQYVEGGATPRVPRLGSIPYPDGDLNEGEILVRDQGIVTQAIVQFDGETTFARNRRYRVVVPLGLSFGSRVVLMPVSTSYVVVGLVPTEAGMDWKRPVEDWKYPTLLNNWVNYLNSWEQARFRRGIDGRVEIQGLVRSGTAGTVFNLPVGYRPDSGLLYATVGGNAFARLNVFANGDVGFESYVNNSFLSLNCIFTPATVF